MPPEMIVWTFIYDVEPYTAYETIETMSFTEREGKTTLTTRSVFPSPEIREGMIVSGMEQGSREAMDRLEEHLRTMA